MRISDIGDAGVLTAARRTLRGIVPEFVRRNVAQGRRWTRDLANGDVRRLVRKSGKDERCDWHSIITVRQEIKRSPLWEGKLANILRGCELVDGVMIEPGRLLSLWSLIGRPDTVRGFAVGRAIRNDEPGGDVGGGLCQLSGLIYELGLRGGLAVAERHPHSRDLYATEAERFTPLGLDATVVWPWKDLRLRNDHGSAVALHLRVEDMALVGELLAAEPIEGAELAIERVDGAGTRAVTVRRDGVVVSRDQYAVHGHG